MQSQDRGLHYSASCGKNQSGFTGARDSEWQWHQLGICKSASCPRKITTPASHHSVFYRPDALPAAQPTVSKHWHIINWIIIISASLSINTLGTMFYVYVYCAALVLYVQFYNM